MATSIQIRGRAHSVGRLDSEPSSGKSCEECGETASPHFCEPRVAKLEKNLAKLQHPNTGYFVPMVWQRQQIIEPFFGVVVWHKRWQQWIRRYRVLWCTIPRKNGKSFIVGALTALHMRKLEGSALLLGAQNKIEAQSVIGGIIKGFVENSTMLEDFKYNKMEMAFKSEQLGTSCRIVSIDKSESARGEKWAWAVMDEVAFLKNPEESAQIIRSSWGDVREPVLIQITTLPGNVGEWGRTTNIEMQEVLADPDKMPDTLPVIYMIGDGEDYRDPGVQRRVNPALEEGFLDEVEVELQVKAAESNTAKLSQLLTERFNAPAVSDDAFVSREVWLGQRKKLGRDEILDKLSQIHYGVYGGADFSRVSDFTSIAIVGAVGEYMYIWQQSWVPEPVRDVLDKRLGGKVTEWIDQGHLRILPEGATSEYVAQSFHEIIKPFTCPVMIGYDEHEAEEAHKYWDANSVTVEKCPQGPVLSPAIKQMQDLAHARLLVHGDDPVLDFAANCAEVKINDKEKYAIRKPTERGKSPARVDPLVAAITALHTRTRNLELSSEWVGKMV